MRSAAHRTLVATCLPLLYACGGESEAPRATRWVTVYQDGFENEAWGGAADRTEAESHEGNWAGRLAPECVLDCEARSRAIDIGDASRLHLTLWRRVSHLDSGQLQIKLLTYEDAPPEHPAIPAGPRPLREVLLEESWSSEPDWARCDWEVRLNGRLSRARWVRVQLRFQARTRDASGPGSAPTSIPLSGEVLFDAIELNALRSVP